MQKNMEYNSEREPIILKEYGRNVQKLIEYIRTEGDKEKRTQMAYTLLELIRQLTPSIKDQPENPQRLWDDLFIIADFNLDINSPYPIPERDILFKKPRKVEYPQSRIRYKHYGKNIEKLVKEALKIENKEDRDEAIVYLGKLMKTFYSSWNKESLDDSVILKDIALLSDGELKLDLDKVKEDNLFEMLYREKRKPRPQQNSGGRQGGHRNFKKNNNNNNRRRRDQ
jgi:hypothetical protein